MLVGKFKILVTSLLILINILRKILKKKNVQYANAKCFVFICIWHYYWRHYIGKFNLIFNIIYILQTNTINQRVLKMFATYVNIEVGIMWIYSFLGRESFSVVESKELPENYSISAKIITCKTWFIIILLFLNCVTKNMFWSSNLNWNWGLKI